MLVAFSDGKGAKAKAVRERGYDISLGERDPQVAAVAVPVFDLAGKFRRARRFGADRTLQGESAPRRHYRTFECRQPAAENNSGQRRIGAAAGALHEIAADGATILIRVLMRLPATM